MCCTLKFHANIFPLEIYQLDVILDQDYTWIIFASKLGQIGVLTRPLFLRRISNEDYLRWGKVRMQYLIFAQTWVKIFHPTRIWPNTSKFALKCKFGPTPQYVMGLDPGRTLEVGQRQSQKKFFPGWALDVGRWKSETDKKESFNFPLVPPQTHLIVETVSWAVLLYEYVFKYNKAD